MQIKSFKKTSKQQKEGCLNWFCYEPKYKLPTPVSGIPVGEDFNNQIPYIVYRNFFTSTSGHNNSAWNKIKWLIISE